MTFNWKLPVCPAMVIVGVVAHHLRADHHRGFRDHRIDLARHDRTARLQRRQFDFAQARQRPGIHPAQVVGDLHQRHRQRIELARELDRIVLRRRCPRTCRWPIRICVVVSVDSVFAIALPKRGSALMPVPIAVPPMRQAAQALQCVFDPRPRATPSCADQRAEFLAERQRHRIHQVGAAGLGDPAECLARGASMALPRCLSAGSRSSTTASCARHADRGRDHVVGTLPEVDVVVRMDLALARARRQRGDHLVGIHVARRAGTGLVRRRSGIARRWSPSATCSAALRIGRATPFGSRPSPALTCCRGRLDQAERADETTRHRLARDREILHRALGLRAPQRIGGHLQLAHAVVLDAEPCRAMTSSIRLPRGYARRLRGAASAASLVDVERPRVRG